MESESKKPSQADISCSDLTASAAIAASFLLIRYAPRTLEAEPSGHVHSPGHVLEYQCNGYAIIVLLCVR